MVRGHLSPRFLPLDAFGARLDLKTYGMGGGVIGPRDNVFPGPAVALDGPALVSYQIALQHSKIEPAIHAINHCTKTCNKSPGILHLGVREDLGLPLNTAKCEIITSDVTVVAQFRETSRKTSSTSTQCRPSYYSLESVVSVPRMTY